MNCKCEGCNMSEEQSCCMLYVWVHTSEEEKRGKAGFKDTDSNFDDFKHVDRRKEFDNKDVDGGGKKFVVAKKVEKD